MGAATFSIQCQRCSGHIQPTEIHEAHPGLMKTDGIGLWKANTRCLGNAWCVRKSHKSNVGSGLGLLPRKVPFRLNSGGIGQEQQRDCRRDH